MIMTDLMIRNLQIVRAALDKEEIRYFSAPQRLIAYTPCKTDLKHCTLRPTTLRVTINPCDTGILFEVSLPVALHAASEEERRLILRRIAKENYGTIRGGLTYKSETEHLNYRIFYAFGEDAAGFNDDEVTACVKLSAAAISVGYESIVNAQDEFGNDDDFEDMDTPKSVKAELEALFDRLFSSHTETESSLASEADGTDSDVEDGDITVCPDENTPLNPALRSMLDDFLSEDTDSEKHYICCWGDRQPGSMTLSKL